MALFGIGKHTDGKQEKAPKATGAASKPVKSTKVKAAVQAKAAVPAVISVSSTDAASAIVRPRITEKSGLLSQSGVYTFEIAEGATKQTVAKAIRSIYKVAPVKVAIVNLPATRVFVRGRKGMTSGVRKAMVTLKKGEKIDFV